MLLESNMDVQIHFDIQELVLALAGRGMQTPKLNWIYLKLFLDNYFNNAVYDVFLHETAQHAEISTVL